MDLRKEFCDLTAIFGSLAVLFQVYSLYDFMITTKGIHTATPPTTNFMLIGIQQLILLIFYGCITVMAYKLREWKAMTKRELEEELIPIKKELDSIELRISEYIEANKDLQDLEKKLLPQLIKESKQLLNMLNLRMRFLRDMLYEL